MKSFRARMAIIMCGLLLGAFPSAGRAAGGPVPFNDVFFNPIRSESFLGDPWIIQHGGMYYYTHSQGTQISITPSDTISGVMFHADEAVTVFTGSQERLTELWAPELHFYDGFWYVLFAADTDNNNTLHRMYALKSQTEDPLGAYDFLGQIMLPDDQWAIDGTFFEHEGRLYHVWSGWKNEAEGGVIWRQYLYICEMETPATVKEGAQRVRISVPLNLWESSVLAQNEGPVALKSPGGAVYLVYSANFSGSDQYCLGMLTLKGDPLDAGAWVKSDGPVFASNTEQGVLAPGHCSFTKSPDGSEDWMVYHIAKRSQAGWDRMACAQRIAWEDDAPVFGVPQPLAALHTLPGGETVNRVLYSLAQAALSDGAQAADSPGAYAGRMVTLENVRSKVTVTLEVPKKGRYTLLIRYCNPLEDAQTMRVTFGDAKRTTVYAGPSGGPDRFSLTPVTAELPQGQVQVVLQANADMQLDALIMDLNDVR